MAVIWRSSLSGVHICVVRIHSKVAFVVLKSSYALSKTSGRKEQAIYLF